MRFSAFISALLAACFVLSGLVVGFGGDAAAQNGTCAAGTGVVEGDLCVLVGAAPVVTAGCTETRADVYPAADGTCIFDNPLYVGSCGAFEAVTMTPDGIPYTTTYCRGTVDPTVAFGQCVDSDDRLDAIGRCVQYFDQVGSTSSCPADTRRELTVCVSQIAPPTVCDDDVMADPTTGLCFEVVAGVECVTPYVRSTDDAFECSYVTTPDETCAAVPQGANTVREGDVCAYRTNPCADGVSFVEGECRSVSNPTLCATGQLPHISTGRCLIATSVIIDGSPTVEATPEATAEPTVEATAEPTAEPTVEATPEATTTAEATPEPTATAGPTGTPEPTATAGPTSTPGPTAAPTGTAIPLATTDLRAEPIDGPASLSSEGLAAIDGAFGFGSGPLAGVVPADLTAAAPEATDTTVGGTGGGTSPGIAVTGAESVVLASTGIALVASGASLVIYKRRRTQISA